jgi:hypothetical protein
MPPAVGQFTIIVAQRIWIGLNRIDDDDGDDDDDDG